MIRTICGCIFITIVICVPVFVQGGGDILPDVIAVQEQHKNISSVIQYLNTVLPTSPVKVASFRVKNKAKIPCPSISFETRNKNDSYEVQYDSQDRKKVVSFKRSPSYYQERCANESQPCCSQAAAKCKTYNELKTFVRLIVVNGNILLVNSKDNIRVVAVGKYCKCDIWNDIESIFLIVTSLVI